MRAVPILPSRLLCCVFVLVLCVPLSGATTVVPRRPVQGDNLVPPATPLVTCDPYFSIWSPGDRLAEVDTVHWTGRPHRLTAMVRVDGRPFRVMGAEPADLPAMEQTGLLVMPTRTIYQFAGNGVRLNLTFLTPALPEDIDLLARPVTYLIFDAETMDGRSHEVSAYVDVSAEIAVNEPRQRVIWEREIVDGLEVLRVGTIEQPVLLKKGDDLRIDWGYFYLAAPKTPSTGALLSSAEKSREAFRRAGLLPAELETGAVLEGDARAVASGAVAMELGRVGPGNASGWMMLAYDDRFSIQYMRRNLKPYWRHNGWEAADLLRASLREYPSLRERCTAFDDELMSDLRQAGGSRYARLAALAYRQCFAAGKFVADAHGQPLQFCKENHSNGCIGTSDVFYPMAPQFLLFGSSLAKSFLVPFLDYAASGRWKFPFAPHDLGTYPKANGQVYGGGERTEENQMPVEESGNLLILLAAVAELDGDADFAGRYWPQLESWAAYLKEKGFDPENQLCTDDFAGHLAHNVNLSVKAICGLGAFATLCERKGDRGRAEEYRRIAREFAAKWVKEAVDGDHYRLAFDKPGTWSQKYNLVWDRLLDLRLFPSEVGRREMAHYRKIQNAYGLPLDNRETYTKLDWILWTATLTGDPKDFEALVEPVFRFLNETPDRSPMTDWYQTKTARKVGFTARPVVGGVFLQMLYDRSTWRKWASRDRTKAAGWAPIPTPPSLTITVPTARERTGIEWRYTLEKPGAVWARPEFDAGGWRRGAGGFGTRGTPGATVRTEWKGNEIWLRREIELPDRGLKNPHLLVHHDEDAEIFLNGVLAASIPGFTTDYEEVPMSAAAAGTLRPGKNIIAVHCRQTGGGQYIDVGLVEVGE